MKEGSERTQNIPGTPVHRNQQWLELSRSEVHGMITRRILEQRHHMLDPLGLGEGFKGEPLKGEEKPKGMIWNKK